MAVTTFAGASPKFGTNCNICLADLEVGQRVGQRPCGHAFHEQCIRDWLAVKDRCPMRCAKPKASLGVAAPSGGEETEVAAAVPQHPEPGAAGQGRGPAAEASAEMC
mmetsp:Transcript_74944/g.206702  ORF Transcript_74944/g.206702 Transcript_74944/m.206702 type:complete len:107 (-) Transcript_74944:329-649(-)